MFKSVQISIFLILVLCLANCQDHLNGMTIINPQGTNIQNSCFMTIQGEIQQSGIVIMQDYRPSPSQAPAALPQQCSYFTLPFQSMFYNEGVNYTLQPNVSDPNNFVVNATLDANALYAMNGSACFLLTQTEWQGIGQYLCKLMYDTLPLYLAVWGSDNFTFYSNTSTTALWPLGLEQSINATMEANWVGLNMTFPPLVVYLFDSCGSNSNVSTIDVQVVVTTPVNLTATLPGVWLAYTVIKPHDADEHDYSVVASQSNATLFDNWSDSNCWDLGIQYSDLLGSADYCANGCEVSFILANAQRDIYVLETTGLWVGGNASANASSNATSSGPGNGTGISNGSLSNGTSGAVSSASTMGINAVFVALISFILANWL